MDDTSDNSTAPGQPNADAPPARSSGSDDVTIAPRSESDRDLARERDNTDRVRWSLDDLDPVDERRSGHSWAWIVLALVVLALTVMVGVDLHHHDRYELVCGKDQLSLRRGRRMPQPFGFETLGGLFKPLRLLGDTPCPLDQTLHSREAAESAFLGFILQQVSRSLADPQSGQLKLVRQQLLQALQITRAEDHRNRRAEARTLLADLNYREGRARLASLETDLRTALARLRETQRLAGRRYPDVADWILHLQRLLRSISPTPPRLAPDRSLGGVLDVLPPRTSTPAAAPNAGPAGKPAPAPPPSPEGLNVGRGVLM